jgi:hypothetical protein
MAIKEERERFLMFPSAVLCDFLCVTLRLMDFNFSNNCRLSQTVYTIKRNIYNIETYRTKLKKYENEETI